MKAVRLRLGDKPTLEPCELPIPTPGANGVLVRIRAASLNYRDQAVLDGGYGPAKEVVALSDGAGEVVAVGDRVTRTKVGERVTASCVQQWVAGPSLPEYAAGSFGFTADGWLAEYVMLHEAAVVRLPDHLDFVDGASLACAGVTAWTALHRAGPLQPGQTVLVQGTGGVSVFALQFARLAGARVLAIASSDEKAARLRELGAEAVVNHRTRPDWDREILALTDGAGVDKVVEVAGEKTLARSVAATRRGGDVALVGFATGLGGELTVRDILFGSVSVGGVQIGPRLHYEALLAAMAAHGTRPVIDRVFAFPEHRDAYARLASGAAVGKVVIEMGR